MAPHSRLPPRRPHRGSQAAELLLQAGCAALFAQPAAPGHGRRAAGPARSQARAAYTAADTADFKHRRTHPNILGYNAAAAAAWLDGGMPLLDAGALSLHPAVINGPDEDRLHYGYNLRPDDSDTSPANPFSALCWQMVLHTHAANGTFINGLQQCKWTRS